MEWEVSWKMTLMNWWTIQTLVFDKEDSEKDDVSDYQHKNILIPEEKSSIELAEKGLTTTKETM